MSDCILESTTRKARKDHLCDACVLLIQLVNNTAEAIAEDLGCSEDELISLKAAEANNWKVKKGDEYLFCSGIYDGVFFTNHSIPAIHSICVHYDIYDF